MKNPAKLFSSLSLLKTLLFSGILILGFFNSATAQNDTTVESKEEKSQFIEIKLLEGTTIIGKLIEDADDKFVIYNEAIGEVDILKSKIESYNILGDDNFKDGVYWHPTVNSSRSIFTPTGYGLKKGEGYYQNFLVFINQVSIGVTDQFSIGLGFEFASLLARIGGDIEGESPIPAFMLTPKFSIPIKKDKWNVGVGGLLLHVPYGDFTLASVYGVSTWGGRDHNITLGAGIAGVKADFGFDDDEDNSFQMGKRPAFTLSGTTRLSKRIAMVTENWFISTRDDGSVTFNSVGVRYLGNRVSVDLSIIGGGGGGDYAVSPIPMVGVTIPFGTGWGK